MAAVAAPAKLPMSFRGERCSKPATVPRDDVRQRPILVRSLAGIELVKVHRVLPSVKELRAEIEVQCGVPYAQQRLIHQGRILRTSDVLCAPGAGAPLEVVLVQVELPKEPTDLQFLQPLPNRDVGELWACERVGGGEALAVKLVPLPILSKCMSEADKKHLIHIQEVLKHPRLAEYRFHFEDATHLYLGTALPVGGSLAKKLADSGEPCVSNATAARYTYQLCEALVYLHSRTPEKAVHWHLNLDTVWLDAAGSVMLRDVGWSSAFTHFGLSLREFNCSPDYLAPETIIGAAHSESLDMWQVGVLLYRLLTGVTPFHGPSAHDTHHRIVWEAIQFPEGFDPDARKLISDLCRKKPTERLTAEQAMEHGFFTKYIS